MKRIPQPEVIDRIFQRKQYNIGKTTQSLNPLQINEHNTYMMYIRIKKYGRHPSTLY